MNNHSSSQVIRQFFAAFGAGDVDGVVALFHPEATITAVRAGTPSAGQHHGAYLGLVGVRAFLAKLASTFDTKAFSVDHVLGEGPMACASGQFVHQLRSTGKRFESAWALVCQVEGGLIRSYRFFEDSAAFEAARA